MKYIIFRSPEGPRVSIFAAPTTHAEEAAAHPSWKPESAGFLVFRSIDCVQCFDRSESLNLKPRAMDDSMIEVLTRRHSCSPPFLPHQSPSVSNDYSPQTPHT